MHSRFCLVFLIALAAVAADGCGRSRSPSLHGKVTLDGEPVANGSIVFLPSTSDGPRAAAAIEGGNYTVPASAGLAAGTYRVEINWRQPTGRKLPSADPGIEMDETKEAIPSKYNADSTLTAELTAGDVTKDFALTTK